MGFRRLCLSDVTSKKWSYTAFKPMILPGFMSPLVKHESRTTTPILVGLYTFLYSSVNTTDIPVFFQYLFQFTRFSSVSSLHS